MFVYAFTKVPSQTSPVTGDGKEALLSPLF